jgi:hypothetical protein
MIKTIGVLAAGALITAVWFVAGSYKIAKVPVFTQQNLQGSQEAAVASSVKSSGPVLTHANLVALADNRYAKGAVPVGDYKYVTSAAKKGYIYLCNVHKDNPGASVIGTWLHGTTWNPAEKVSVQGTVSWPKASFSDIIANGIRTLMGNGLPTDHTTGVFPVKSSDPAAHFDSNPNTISTQSLLKKLPTSPTYLDVPQCMGGEVGIMISGVPLFNGFDAGLRDAQAHEVQDSCDGHPQDSGEYHYHGMSSCFKDQSVETVLGFALDGFPITGPKVTDKKYLTTDNLDMCHGITSEVVLDGKRVTTYHYVLTTDFPYSASCFRGKPVSMQVISGGQQSAAPSGTNQSQTAGRPPQQAINACSGKTSNATCSFTGGRGETVSGTCQTPPNQSLVCVPAGR